jgi:hypothetical protein
MTRATTVLALSAACMIWPMAISGWSGIGAPPPTTTVFGSRTQTLFSIGIQYDFGDQEAQLVGAIRHTKTNASNNVTGGKFDIALPIFGEKKFQPTIRVLGLAGSRTVQGELGVGFEMGSNSALIGAGVQVPYANGGVNYVFVDGFEPYLGINSIGKAKSHSSTTVVVPPVAIN